MFVMLAAETNNPLPGLASLCSQHSASSQPFSSRDQTLLCLFLVSFDASLDGCEAVLVSCCFNNSEVISVPASVETMSLEGGNPTASPSSPPFVYVFASVSLRQSLSRI